MEITNKILRDLISYSAKYDINLLSLVEGAEHFKSKVSSSRREIRKAREVFEGVVERSTNDIECIQKLCGHWSTTHFSGSGNNDSFVKCNICEKELSSNKHNKFISDCYD